MKITPRLLALALGVGWLVGCASRQENIVLSSSPEVHLAETSPAPASAKRRINEADESQIQQEVFSYLLTRHFWDDNDCSAIFVQAKEAVEKALIKKFPNHLPPIKPSYHASLRNNQTPLDRDTNKPAMVLSVDINEPNEDGSVAAIGRWYAGGAVAGFYTFKLMKVGENWEVKTAN
jgi:hypothetical protein